MHEVQANRWAYKQATDYAPEDMPSFMQRWRGVSSRNALVSLYKALPEPGQQYFREALTNDPTGGVRSFLTGMIENTKGSEQKSFQQTFDTAQENFEKRGLEFSDRNERIPFEFEEWMEKSDKPEVRLAVLKSSSPVTAWAFGNVIEGLPPAALRQMIANGALEYVAPEYKNAAWEHALSKLPEDQKAELLREVRDKQNPAYPNLAAIKFNFDFNAKPRPPLADNLGALRLDSKVHAKKIEPLTGKAQSAPNNITGIVLDSLPLEPAKPAHPFDIKFDRFDTAWAPEKVNQYMTVETRSISFTPEGREGLVGHKEWSDFENWGVDSREVPVNVYRFPGIEAEIVVPSDYAKILDQVRQGRLNSNEPNSHAAPADGIAFVPHDQRILPEEIAQLLIQLPNSDIVKSVELLDHADPWNLKNNHDQLVQARENGEALPERDFVALADADGQGLGRIRFYNSTSNHPAQMQETMSHEWAHLVEQNEAYKAFENAEDLERNGFYARDYARKNASENWAVHLGEEFLARDGEGFADLPEKAPARTLVMAKALRNMLEQRKDNPSPKHDEFLKRVNAAESIATQRLQEGIREDIAKGDENSLADKLHFLNIAASRGKSPEMLHKVLAPLDAELRPVLEARGRGDKLANEVIANRLGALQAENYSPDLMPELSRRWGAMTDSTAQMELFRRLPDEAKESLLEDLSTNAVDSTPSLLNGLIKENSGHTKKLFKDIWEIAQANFEAQGLALYRSGQAIPKPYLRWMETSDIPEARLAALKNRDTRAATHNFNELTREFEPQALRKFIAGDAMSYVDSEFKDVVWKHVLQRLPQEEQVKLFRELGREHDPAYRKIATRINKMDATEFDAEFDNIRKDSLKILLKRESTPEYIMSHPDRIKDARSFIDTTKKMGEQPIIDLIQAGALDSLSIDDIDTIVKSTSQRFDAAALVDILGAIKPDRESLSLINELSTLSENDDPEVATRAQKLLVDIGDAQLMFLKAKSEREDGRNAYECYDALESFLMNADNARARLLYVNADLYNPHGATVADKIRWGALDLSDSQMLEYLRSGIVDLLTPAERNKFLRTVSLDASPEVNAQLKSMGLKPARR
jgi:hypothetical protein